MIPDDAQSDYADGIPSGFVTVCGVRIPRGSGWPHGDVVVQAMLERCRQSEILKFLDELQAHIATMGIGPHFNRERYADQHMDNHEASPSLDIYDLLAGAKLNEAGHKRASLQFALNGIRRELMMVFARLVELRLDVEAANADFKTGDQLPTASNPEVEDRLTSTRPN